MFKFFVTIILYLSILIHYSLWISNPLISKISQNYINQCRSTVSKWVIPVEKYLYKTANKLYYIYITGNIETSFSNQMFISVMFRENADLQQKRNYYRWSYKICDSRLHFSPFKFWTFGLIDYCHHPILWQRFNAKFFCYFLHIIYCYISFYVCIIKFIYNLNHLNFYSFNYIFYINYFGI